MDSTKVVKTYADWKGDLGSYLNIGDIVDEEMFNYFLNVLPPACWTSRILQIGEPNSHVNGKATYSTLEKTSDGWVFRGSCYRGETVEQRDNILTVRFAN
jgi:hypothetical protein